MRYIKWLWDLADWPLQYAEKLTDKEFASAWHFVAKLFLVLIVLYVLVDLASRIYKIIRRGRRSSWVDAADIDALASTKNVDVVNQVRSRQRLKERAKQLKKAKEYGTLANLYSEAGHPKEAAKWYKKIGNQHKAAMEIAKSGNTLKAARLFLKEGDYESAAQYFMENARYQDAAAAYEKAGKPVLAASAYGKAGNTEQALKMFIDYFKTTGDAMDIQIQAAHECYKTLQHEQIAASVTEEQKRELYPLLAERFEREKNPDLAARLFQSGGDLVRAGETFILAGKLDEAAACMKQAGKKQEASRILGRLHESKGNWREAATAYAAAGNFLHAGEAFIKAKDAGRAADCFIKAKEYYRAGLAFAHAGRFSDAIKVLQRVKEDHPNFEASRGVLGRCFYEMHDYAHCVAALENHLTGKRVDSAHLDYFYMLALAYEQTGRLEDSLQILRRIHTVDVDFRDVTQRISSVSSRISMNVGSDAVAQPQAQGTTSGQMMKSVENALEGRYDLQKELGRGGMGVVYLARDKQLDRPVALKFLGSLIDDSDEFRERFVREARTAAKISHPNIVSIYDISASEGRAYIAMEYVEGVSLYRYLAEKGALPAREAINYMVQACSALGAIHKAGITHRDIKPDNILIAKGGLIKIMDFGLAKSEDNRLTRAGIVMGTPSYMPPEQARGKECDARSDIYSIGMVLHECLTGKIAFANGNVLERQVKEMPPPPSTLNDAVPKELDDIVMKCIQKNPEDRYDTMESLAADLRALNLKA
ncbi:MAG: protein kinase [Candidatus Hydrogenedentota bacterium]